MSVTQAGAKQQIRLRSCSQGLCQDDHFRGAEKQRPVLAVTPAASLGTGRRQCHREPGQGRGESSDHSRRGQSGDPEECSAVLRATVDR